MAVARREREGVGCQRGAGGGPGSGPEEVSRVPPKSVLVGSRQRGTGAAVLSSEQLVFPGGFLGDLCPAQPLTHIPWGPAGWPACFLQHSALITTGQASSIWKLL